MSKVSIRDAGNRSEQQQREDRLTAVEELGKSVGVVAACEALDVPRATLYRRRRPTAAPSPRAPSHRALRAEERAQVLATLNGARFADKAPAEVYGTLLDEGTYLCSVSTMYRLLRENGLVRERRDQLTHPAYTKPELLATGPTLAARYHAVLGYAATYADRYAGPSVEFGVEVLPRRGGASGGGTAR